MFAFESKLHFDNLRMIQLYHKFPLIEKNVLFATFYDVVFVHHLECIEFAIDFRRS